MYSNIYVALVHYPVFDKNGDIVSTSITNHDIHDISRLVRTYDLGGYYMVTPLISQQELCRRIIKHWVEGFGSQYNQTRQVAFATTYLVDSLEDVIRELHEKCGQKPTVVITSAREYVATLCQKPLWRFKEAGITMKEDTATPYLIVLGTGYGLETECIKAHGDVVLEPIRGLGDYNHLSVRSAAAIMIDRLFARDV